MPSRSACTALLSLALLTACASFPQPTSDRSTTAGQALLEASAKAHGWEAYRRLRDINVSYDGQWFPAVARLQPVLVDSQFRGSSEERMIVATRHIAQTHRGPGGIKHVARDPQSIAVRYNGQIDQDREKLLAAGLVADGYRLFLLGPMYLLEHGAIVEHAGEDIIDGVEYERLFARLRPGLGHAGEDRVLMWIDKTSRIARRVWISADALPTTQGVIAEIDLLAYRAIAGVRWPTRFFERLKRPFPLEVHQWQLTGLDVDRGYSASDILEPAFQRAAAKPATPLPAP